MSVVARRKCGSPWAITLIAGMAFAAQGALAQDPADGPLPTVNRDRLRSLERALNDGLPYVPGEALVKFQPGLRPAQQARALSVLRGTVAARRQRWIGDLLLVHADNEPDAEAMAARLASQPEVVYAEPNYLSKTKSAPNDPFFSRQWNFDLINMRTAWDINPGGNPDVLVAVVDTGVTEASRTFSFRLWTGRAFSLGSIPYATNPDLASGRFTVGRDLVFFAAGTPVLDMHGHGTHVAGTILQETNNSLGVAGMAYRARLLSVKVCVGYWELQIFQSEEGRPGFIDPDFAGATLCPSDAIVEGVRFAADRGARVINVSLGTTQPSGALREVLRYATSRGSFVAMAVGNEFEEGNPTEYPAAYGAEIDGAMSVGAVGPTSRRAFYSNTGAHLEIVAPGGDHRAGGSSAMISQAGLDGRDFDGATVLVPRFDRYVIVAEQGTSMAAPHVTGLAALLYSQGITNPAAIEAAIKQFARDLGPAGRDNEYGHGLIDARATLRGLGIAR